MKFRIFALMALLINQSAMCENEDTPCEQYMRADGNVLKIVNHRNDHKKKMALLRTSILHGEQLLAKSDLVPDKIYTLDFVFQSIVNLWEVSDLKDFQKLKDLVTFYPRISKLNFESILVRQIRKNLENSVSTLDIHKQSLEFETMIFLFLENDHERFFDFYSNLVSHKNRMRLKTFLNMSVALNRPQFFTSLLKIDINFINHYDFNDGKFLASNLNSLNEAMVNLRAIERQKIWGRIFIYLIKNKDLESLESIILEKNLNLNTAYSGLAHGFLNDPHLFNQYTLLDLCLERKREIEEYPDGYGSKHEELFNINSAINLLRNLEASALKERPPSYKDIQRLKNEFSIGSLKVYRHVFLHVLKKKDWKTFFEMVSRQTLRSEYPYVFDRDSNYSLMLKMIEEHSPVEGSIELLKVLKKDEELPIVPKAFSSEIFIESIKNEGPRVQFKLLFQYMAKNDLEQIYILLRKGLSYNKNRLATYLQNTKSFLWTKSKDGGRRGPEVVSKLSYIQKINDLENDDQ